MSIKYICHAFDCNVGNPVRKLILVKLCDNANDDGIAWPSVKTIARHCECSERSVRNHISQLEDMGVVKVSSQFKDKRQTSNIYNINLSMLKHLQGEGAGDADRTVIESSIKEPSKEEVFSYRKALMSLVNDESLVKDYMDIRRKNKLPNSERAFNGLKNQIDKSHLTYHQAINLCAEKGWKGFKAEWVTNQPVQQTVQHNLNDIASLLNDT